MVQAMSVTPLKAGNVKSKSNGATVPATATLGSPDSPRRRASAVLSLTRVGTARSRHLTERITGIDLSLGRRPKRRGMRIMILGIRGFPNVQGGVEKHAEKLAGALSKLGCEVEAVVRTEYVPRGTKSWQGIRILRLWNSRLKGVETFIHTFCGVVYAALRRPDILHIHNIGPAIFAPLARALGLRVVVTYHSLNYEHAKWGRLARALLRFGEWAGMRSSHGRIAVSRGLAKRMRDTYGVPVNIIPNGLDKPNAVRTTHVLQAFGLSPKRYVLNVARIDEAKRQLDLIAAYARIRTPAFKLALVGEADHFGKYARAVADAARNTPGVVLLGRQTGDALAELYTHAGTFVMPSSHEGQPIAVLEAASYGLSVILSDISAHREIGLPGAHYFAVADVAALERHLQHFFTTPSLVRLSAEDRDRLIASHDWDDIARRTLAIYLAANPKKQTAHAENWLGSRP
jgi:glycosyltransferase involved in cell wall biosynthesis